jgi:hypothetical protein
MTTGLKISTFVLALAAVFGIAFGLGTALDPVTEPESPEHSEPADPTGPADGH